MYAILVQKTFRKKIITSTLLDFILSNYIIFDSIKNIANPFNHTYPIVLHNYYMYIISITQRAEEYYYLLEMFATIIRICGRSYKVIYIFFFRMNIRQLSHVHPLKCRDVKYY